MYLASRILLIITVLAGAYVVLVTTVIGVVLLAASIGPCPVAIACLAIVARASQVRQRKLTTLGSARFASADELKRHGLLGATSGLILGRMP